ncbi:MAG: hypothetical protein H8Z69_03860 [Nanohaloarchaea archaeon]|nr:hypothetical protein [Candidatus Nanohaloarchaea archaeon]
MPKTDRDVYMEDRGRKGKQDRLDSYADSLKESEEENLDLEEEPTLEESLSPEEQQAFLKMGENAKKLIKGDTDA